MKITELDKIINNLPSDTKDIFDRIFKITKGVGKIIPPETMYKWITDKFGSIESVEEQEILRITNIVTYESALFNKLRSRRPIEAKENKNVMLIKEELRRTQGCAFCEPTKLTPQDTFGRINGKYCITASNIAKYDELHGLVIFNTHYPLEFDGEKIYDYLQTAILWIKEANRHYPEAIFPFIMWNCTWRAAASIIHGHMQILLTRQPYSKIEFINNCANNYKNNYWQDLFYIHKLLGVGFEYKGIKILGYLTPIKEKEIMILANEIDESLSDCISKLLKIYLQTGTMAFNLIIMMKPIIEDANWNNFPTLIRIVDRGSLTNRTTDIGGMELYACSIVETDPFEFAEKIKQLVERFPILKK